jgi:uncharacterized protein YjbI with pentapeptide repeats
MDTQSIISENTYQSQTFSDLIMQEKELNKVEFINCNFVNCDFTKSKIKNCLFDNCKFSKSILNIVEFKNTTLSSTKFVNSHMTGIDFSLINNKLGTSLNCSGCNLSYSIFTNINLSNSILTKCKINGAAFELTNLENTDFSESDFKDSNFIKCNLKKCDFRSSINYFFDINTNRCQNAKFSYPSVINLLKWYEIDVD